MLSPFPAELPMPDFDPSAPPQAVKPAGEPVDVWADAEESRNLAGFQAGGDSADLDAALVEALAAVERLEHKPDSAPLPVRDEESAGLRQELEEARRELAKTKSELGRAQVDVAALRRLTQRLETDLPNQTARRLLGDLLPALDHLDTLCQYLLQYATLTGADRQAVEMLDTEWKRALQRLQLEPYDAVGKPFDAQLHEVIATMVDPSQPAGAVLRQAGRGYYLAGKLLRMASVVVNAAANGRQGG